MAGGGLSTGRSLDPWGNNVPTFGSRAGTVPPGYEYDPVSGSYSRSPGAAGSRAGDYVKGFNTAAGIPSISGLMSGVFGGSGGGTSSGGAMGMGGTGTGGASSGGVSGGAGTGIGGFSAPSTLAPPDTRAATNAAYAQAKDQVGAQSRASIQALNGELGATGQMGSGAQVQGTEDIVKNAAGQLGAEANQELQTNAQLGEENKLAGYQGGIAQRGQDIGANVAIRGQNVSAQEAQARLALEANNAAAQRNLQLLTLALGGLSGAGSSGAGYGPIHPGGQSY